MLKKININILSRIIISVCFILYINLSYSQTAFRNNPKKYYETLFKNLNSDSLYVYEVNSSWGSGIAYFISFEKCQVSSGYYLNNNFTYKQLSGRRLLPVDSSNSIFKIIYDNKIDTKKLILFIDKLKIFNLPYDYSLKDKCIKDFISDGSNFQLSKLTKDTFYYKSYYEIYEYAKLCPHLKEYKKFVELDKLFQSYFNKSKIISQNLIEEYRKR
ncbi:MAG: hypothetical protein NVSMB45_17260 [Ginsengibacter sp.]